MAGNNTIVCENIPRNIMSYGVWRHNNPLRSSTPLLLMQISLITLTSQLIEHCLRPIGQSSIVSQISAGLIYGPSLVGHNETIRKTLFPLKGAMTLETIGTFGLIFFLFEIGVKEAPKMMVRPERKALIIGFLVMSVTFALTVPLSLLVRKYITLDPTLHTSLPIIAASQCLTAFPSIAGLLTELKILNTDLSRLAISASMFCDVIGITLSVTFLALIKIEGEHSFKPIMSVLSAVFFVVFLVFVIRPGIFKLLSLVPEGKSLGEDHMLGIFVLVLIAGLVSETIGQHYIFGPLMLGLVVPEGPPLGAALITRMDYLAKFFYPTFLTTNGLKTNMFKVHLKSFWIVGFIVIFATLVKIGTVMIAARFLHIAFRQAIIIGLALNARGIIELIIYNLLRDAKVLGIQEFSILVIFVIIITATITPLIKFLHDSEHYTPVKRRTIQRLKHGVELRVLVCIHSQDTVPSIVNLLEASGPTEESPIAVIAVLLIEIVGRTTPVLVEHQSGRALRPSNSSSSRIINALHQLKLHHETCVTVQSFSSITHYATMHEDVCKVALEQHATIVILPFHKKWEFDGSIALVKRPIQAMNLNVIKKAPCSIGIFIDKGTLSGNLSILNNQSTYNVGVIYIGGPDDAESLAYGARMAQHGNVTLTIIRFLLFGADSARERKLDHIIIDEVREDNIGNDRFIYQEQVVRDGEGLAASIGTLKDSFELIIVGQYHGDSPLLKGLHDWTVCPELGIIGDMLASPDFGSTASVLVIRQQSLKRMMNPSTKQVAPANSDSTILDIPLSKINSA